MATVFFSYSHEDEELRNRLEKHLAMLKRDGSIQAWHDRRILAGADLDQAILANLEAADVILLLVSADFLASDYCYSKEMERAVQRHHEGTAVVIPVILKACDWTRAPFGRLNAVPRDAKAVTSWSNHEEAFADIAGHVRQVVEHRNKTAAARSGRSSTAAVPPSAPVGPMKVAAKMKHEIRQSVPGVVRSSNLRLKKEFTERDKDAFLHESFDFFAEFFQGSLAELQERNAGIETDFRRIDANAFTCFIYREGKKVSECAIRLGGFIGNDITYAGNANSQGNSYNESLSVAADDQSLFFTAMGMPYGGKPDDRMSREAAAEYLWGMLLQRLQ